MKENSIGGKLHSFGGAPEGARDSYDIFISHRSLNKPWVKCLARNLIGVGFHVFLDEWELVGGKGFIERIFEVISHAQRGILVATSEAIESGWVCAEYEAMLKRSREDSSFHFVPAVFGEIPGFPFLDNVQCIDFRVETKKEYRRVFYELLCGLELRPPGADGTFEGPLVFPDPINPTLPKITETSLEEGVSEKRFLDKIFRNLGRHSILMLLAQADRGQHYLLGSIESRARGELGVKRVLKITPPYSDHKELGRYFAHLGAQSAFSEEIADPLDWEEALLERLRSLDEGESLLLLISGFENGSEAGRCQLAGVLRSLTSRQRGLRVILCGCQRLAELKFGSGELSLLNDADVHMWPEISAGDLLVWQQREFPRKSLGEEEALEVLRLCGGHPRLLRYCLQYREEGVAEIAKLKEALRKNPSVLQFFTPFSAKDTVRERICNLLSRHDLGPASPWPVDVLLRRLYWSNLVVIDGERFRWRCDLLREVGSFALGCAKR